MATFSDRVIQLTNEHLADAIAQKVTTTTLGGTFFLPSYGGSPPVAYDRTELRPTSSRERCERYISEITAAIRSGIERKVDEEKPSGKKSQAVTPNESYNKWKVSRGTTNTSLYEQLAVKGVEFGRSTKPPRLGNITSTQTW